jgi:RimK family alpha-L-glutamate ligase
VRQLSTSTDVRSIFQARRPDPRFLLGAARLTETNGALLAALDALGVNVEIVDPQSLEERVRAGDTVLGRLDVLPSLDGVEPGLWELERLERRGLRVLNRASALLASHDKLMTALRLGRVGLAHPRTWHVDDGMPPPALEPPVVVKPRFGSWGVDVVLCETRRELRSCLRRLSGRGWFRRQGALVQEFVPASGADLRLVVVRGLVVGAIERVAARGEWRTNVALGGARRSTVADPAARLLALGAAAAVGGDLVGVDIVRDPLGRLVVLEVNGAVDFTREYSHPGEDVFAEVARALVPSAAGAATEEEALGAV